jgi:hypothetical protein
MTRLLKRWKKQEFNPLPMSNSLLTRAATLVVALGFFFSCGSSKDQLRYAELINKGDYAKAVKQTQEDLNGSPTNADLHYQLVLGRHYQLVNADQSQVPFYSNAFNEAYKTADSLLRREERDASLKKITDIYHETYRKLVNSSINLTAEIANQKKRTLALAYISAAQDLAPDSLKPKAIKVDIFLAEERYSEAKPLLLELSREDEQFKTRHLSRLATAHLKTGREEAAYSAYNELLGLMPTEMDAGVLANMLTLYFKLEDWDRYAITIDRATGEQQMQPRTFEIVMKNNLEMVRQVEFMSRDIQTFLQNMKEENFWMDGPTRVRLGNMLPGATSLSSETKDLLSFGLYWIEKSRTITNRINKLYGLYHQEAGSILLERSNDFFQVSKQDAYKDAALYHFRQAVPFLLSYAPTIYQDADYWRTLANIYTVIEDEDRAQSIKNDLKRLN